ncbi:hypothetical protein Tco_1006323 [Tanacetum coccineum]|uniref:Uncharacterized protein n=1 Tax=Tanacetum coccineum TaxID=301880 RepID=A0ABQ5FIM1_9ASTR
MFKKPLIFSVWNDSRIVMMRIELLVKFALMGDTSQHYALLETNSLVGYGDYIGEDEVYYPTMPSIFYPTPEEVDGNPTPVSDKPSDPKTNDFASCDSSDKSSPKSGDSSVFSDSAALQDFSHLIKDYDFYENKMGVYSMQRESRPMWNNVDNIPPFIPQAAHGRSGNVTFLAGSVNVPAPIPAGRQTRPTPIYVGIPVPAGRQNRPALVYADRPFPAGRRTLSQFLLVGEIMLLDQCPDLQTLIFRIIVGLFIMTKCIWVREDGELLLSPQQVVHRETVDHICKGDPRTMMDLNNLHGLTLIDPLGRLKSEMAWVSQCI